MEQILAAMVAHTSCMAALELEVLPQPGTWHRVDLAGGFALMTGAGVFVLDDWHASTRLDLDALASICRHAVRIDHELTVLETHEIARLAHEVGQLIRS